MKFNLNLISSKNDGTLIINLAPHAQFPRVRCQSRVRARGIDACVTGGREARCCFSHEGGNEEAASVKRELQSSEVLFFLGGLGGWLLVKRKQEGVREGGSRLNDSIIFETRAFLHFV